MKKLLYFLFCVSFVFTGCVQSEDDIFDLTSAKRAENLKAECQNTLLASTNGWVMEYYPNIANYGGLFMYMTFNDESVAITEEADLSKTATSLYSLKLDNGPVLSFDTYNDILHKYSDPGSNGVGYGGDYEFVIVSVSDDEIVFAGKKNYEKIYMHRLPEGKTFSQYLEEREAMDYYLNVTGVWNLVDGNDTLHVQAGGDRHFTTSTSADFMEYENIGAVPTTDGIHFNPALELNGKSYSYFKLSEDKQSFVPVESGLSGKMAPAPASQYFATAMANGKIWSVVLSEDQMGEKFKNGYNVVAASCKAQGKTLAKVGLCVDKTTSQYALQIEVSQRIASSTGNFYYDFSEDNNVINYSYKGTYDRNGESFVTKYGGIVDFATLLGADYDVIPTISYFEPTTLKLVSKTDPTLWFVVKL